MIKLFGTLFCYSWLVNGNIQTAMHTHQTKWAKPNFILENEFMIMLVTLPGRHVQLFFYTILDE